MDDRAYDDKTRIIICKFDDYRIGIVVDMVKDVFTVFEKTYRWAKTYSKTERMILFLRLLNYRGLYISFRLRKH